MKMYNRILLKISGEALAGDKRFGIDQSVLSNICRAVKDVTDLGVEVAIVVGGGNYLRGRECVGMDHVRADHMGMLATVINSIAVGDCLEKLGLEVRVMTALAMQQIAELYIRNRAVRHLEKGRVIILACGTGSPFFSTDTTAALRAAEIGADIIFKASLVDGVYDMDPHKFPNAKKYDRLNFSDVLSGRLAVIDSTAATMCRDNKIPILVFDLTDPENIVRAARGENIGTIIEEA